MYPVGSREAPASRNAQALVGSVSKVAAFASLDTCTTMSNYVRLLTARNVVAHQEVNCRATSVDMNRHSQGHCDSFEVSSVPAGVVSKQVAAVDLRSIGPALFEDKVDKLFLAGYEACNAQVKRYAFTEACNGCILPIRVDLFTSTYVCIEAICQLFIAFFAQVVAQLRLGSVQKVDLVLAGCVALPAPFGGPGVFLHHVPV